MSGRLYLDEIYSKSGQTKVLDTTSFDANNNFEASNTGFNLNYQSANAALNVVQSGTGDALRVNSNALVVDASGNVGIGTSSPIRTLTVSQAGTAEFVLQDTTRTVDGRNFRIFYDNGGLAFGTLNDAGTAGTERMRIDSSGNLLVGTNSTYTNTLLNVNGEINATRFHTFRYNESGTGAKTFYFYANASQGQGDFNYANYGTGHVFELAISAVGAFNEAGCVWTGWTDGDQAWRTMSSYSQGQFGSFAFATGVTNGSGWVRITWNPYNANYSCVFKINIRRINSHH